MTTRGRMHRGTSTARQRRGRSVVLMGLAVMIPLAVLATSAVGLASPDPEDRVREIASELRCVVCQNLSVADSPSELAKEMRNLVRELVQQGKTPEEIKAYFQSRYGDFVLLEPPKRGFNLLVWGLPFVALLGGACGIYLVARRWTERREPTTPPVDPGLLERVRRELREREGSGPS